MHCGRQGLTPSESPKGRRRLWLLRWQGFRSASALRGYSAAIHCPRAAQPLFPPQCAQMPGCAQVWHSTPKRRRGVRVFMPQRCVFSCPKVLIVLGGAYPSAIYFHASADRCCRVKCVQIPACAQVWNFASQTRVPTDTPTPATTVRLQVDAAGCGLEHADH